MREVLSRLIGSSFKSGAVLKRLEVGEQRRRDYWLETMKVSKANLKKNIFGQDCDVLLPAPQKSQN